MIPGIVNLFSDEEVRGRIYTQYCVLTDKPFLSEKIKERYNIAVIDILFKCLAVKYHHNRFIQEEIVASANARERLKKNRKERVTEFVLQFEFEAYLFQIRSCLDKLAKLLNIVVESKISTTTFGKRGERISKSLEKIKKDKSIKTETVEMMLQLIKKAQERWLEKVILARISLNKIRTLQGYHYIPNELPNGEITIEKPLFAGKPAVELMGMFTEELCLFAQEFITFSIDLVVPRAHTLTKANSGRMKRKYKELGKYVKYEYVTSGRKMSFEHEI